MKTLEFLTAIYYALLCSCIVAIAVALLGWQWWVRFGIAALALFVPLAIYFVMKAYMSFVLVPAMVAERASDPVGLDHAPDTERVQHRLDDVRAVGGDGIAWVDDGVRAWLASPPGVEKDRARNALLDRLYAYAASSNGDYVQRKAVNDLRLAINPWVND